MHATTTTTFYLKEPYDFDAPTEGSNQPASAAPTFRMQVRQVILGAWWMPRLGPDWSPRIGVEGRRYKRDGSLGMVRAYAEVQLGDLPAEVRAEVDRLTELLKATF